MSDSSDLHGPVIEVRVNLTVVAQADQAEERTVPQYLAGVVQAPLALLRPAKKSDRVVLDNIQATFRPGQSTLVLAPPGAGSSTLLRAVTGQRLAPGARATAEDGVQYNGVPLPYLERGGGCIVKKLAAYCSDEDNHEMLFTVREVFELARATAVPGASVAAGSAAAPTAAEMITAMGLQRAADTICGSALIKGISGGEKRRTSVGEALLQNARVVALDNPTNGLDSAAAFAVVLYAAARARDTRGVLLCVLQQPTPEIVNCFDNVLLLSHGHLLFHGPVTDLDACLTGMGFLRPSWTNLAEWAMEVISNPAHAAAISRDAAATGAAGAGGAALPPPAAVLAHAHTSVEALAYAWRHLRAARKQAAGDEPAALAGGVPLPAPGSFARAQYGAAHALSFWQQLRLLTWRQLTLARRNWLFVAARLVLTVGMGAMLGSCFRNEDGPMGDATYYLFYSCALFGLCFIAFINNGEIPFSFLSRAVAYKHTNAGLYSEWSYSLAVIIAHLPLTVVSDLCFATLLYCIPGYTLEGGRWALFCLVVLLMDLAVSVQYRLFTYAAASMEQAMITSSVYIAVGLSTGNYFIQIAQVGWWLRWLIYVSPFFWSTTAIANNEFSADHYSAPYGTTGSTKGEAFMATFSFPFSVGAKWGGVAILAGFYLVVGLLLQPLALRYVRHDVTRGTTRTLHPLHARAHAARQHAEAVAAAAVVVAVAPASPAADDEDDVDEVDEEEQAEDAAARERKWHLGVTPPVSPVAAAVANPALQPAPAAPAAAIVPTPAAAAAAAPQQQHRHIPFTPTAYAFKNVGYSVPLPAAKAPAGAAVKGGVYTKTLLADVSGFALPGTMTALMGPSGAGKTTLLNALSFRTTSGAMTGTVALNGAPAGAALFARSCGFAEQFDEHWPTATVRESLEFSAALRLPPGVPAAARAGFVDDVLEVLELTAIARRQTASLRRGELKRLSVGVELASGCSVLFLDEPTTGLDSRSAAMVLRVLRRVASMGRTVIATIHQPSADVFFSFDSLLLLAPGGKQVYFGPLGAHAATLVGFLSAAPGVPPLPLHTNPASWMLDTIEAATAAAAKSAAAAPAAPGAGAAAAPVTLWGWYAASAEATAAAAGVDKHLQPPAGPTGAVAGSPASASASPSSWATQLAAVLRRGFVGSYREGAYNGARIVAMTFLGLFYGFLYWNLDGSSFQGVQSRLGAILAGGGFMGVICFTVGLPQYVRYRAVFYRERDGRAYRQWIYPASLMLVELPALAVLSVIFTVLFYFLGHFRTDVGAFFYFLLGDAVFAACFLFGAIVASAAFPSSLVGQVAGGVFLAVVWLFGGVFDPVNVMPVWWKWMMYADFAFHLLRGMVADQFLCTTDPCPTMTVSTPFGDATVGIQDSMATVTGSDYAGRAREMGIALGILGGFCLAVLASYRAFNWQTK